MKTIAAISTPTGAGAIGIVRLSGSSSLKIINEIFVAKNKKPVESHTLRYGHIMDGNSVTDEVLVSFMFAPNSYTKEDVVEINCHGGHLSAVAVLALCLKKGAVMAEPGEFTKRAFLNGRLDLAQAEAVIDIINAETETARNLALNTLRGKLGKEVESIKNRILEFIAFLEVAIDYPDEGYFTEAELIQEGLASDIKLIEEMLENSRWLNLIKNGIDTVIVGRPNVGKSSLLNALLKENRAIVTDIPGTTRDIITGKITMGNIPLNITDTAGLRKTSDLIESMGQERTLEQVEKGDLVLAVIDGSLPLTEEDINLIKSIEKNLIIVVNKKDLELKADLETLKGLGMVVHLSAKENFLTPLEEAIANLYPANIKENITALNMRHRESLELALNSLKPALETSRAGLSEEFISLDLQDAYGFLNNILGEGIGEEIIDTIFSKFCLGK